MLSKVNLPPNGWYIIAVSGGMDSMVLLDILSTQTDLELIVAHFNHGLRADSVKDEQLVSQTAKKYGLKVETSRAQLGKASEATARRARYDFLERIRSKYDAKAVITAHHQDDLIETAFLNILRGSGPRGLTAIMDNPKVLRPLIDVPLSQIEKYAKGRGLKWREDTTNNQDLYLRNYIRHHITPKLQLSDRKRLLLEIDKVAKRQAEKHRLLATISHKVVNKNHISRAKYVQLPSEVADELMRYWLRHLNVSNIDRVTISRLSLALKTSHAGRRQPVRKNLWLNIDTKSAYFFADTPHIPLELQSQILASVATGVQFSTYTGIIFS